MSLYTVDCFILLLVQNVYGCRPWGEVLTSNLYSAFYGDSDEDDYDDLEGSRLSRKLVRNYLVCTSFILCEKD